MNCQIIKHLNNYGLRPMYTLIVSTAFKENDNNYYYKNKNDSMLTWMDKNF